jgi:hypothetical protein
MKAPISLAPIFGGQAPPDLSLAVKRWPQRFWDMLAEVPHGTTKEDAVHGILVAGFRSSFKT